MSASPASTSATGPGSPAPSPLESQPADADNGLPSWVWWLLAAGVLLSALGIPLLVRARRRRAWTDRFVAAEAEAAWFARQLVPELRKATGSAERLAGAWQVGGAERVGALEDELTALIETAPEDRSQARALTLRDAVRTGRQRVDALTISTPITVNYAAGELEAVTELVESALASTPPTATPT